MLEMGRNGRQISLELISAVSSSETGAFSCQRLEYMSSRESTVFSLLGRNEGIL